MFINQRGNFMSTATNEQMSNDTELLNNLKLECDSYGISYTGSATVKTLSAKIQAHRKNTLLGGAPKVVAALPNKESEKRKKIKELSLLHRVIITCNDPKLRARGQILKAVSNSYVNFKRVIPFDTPTHVPTIILNSLKETKYVMFGKKRIPGGAEVADPKEVKSFSIEYVDSLSKDELDRIAIRQSGEMIVNN